MLQYHIISTKYTYIKMNLSTVKGPVRQNAIQRPVKLFKKLCNYIMCTTAHN